MNNATVASAGAPPSYAFVARVYRRPLRPIVMAATVLASAWSLMWGISAMMDISGSGSLAPINISLGTLYLVVGLIELFGFIAAWRQNLPMVRLFCFFSILAAVLVLGSESVRFATYFTHKHQLIDNCTANSVGDVVSSYSFWGAAGSSETLTSTQAAQYCSDAWNRAVWSAAAWLLVAGILSCLFISVAFSYYHQLLSPQPLPPSNAFRMGPTAASADPYNPQAGYQYPNRGQRPEDWVPAYDPAKLPGYGDSRVDLHAQLGDGKDAKQFQEEEEEEEQPRAPGMSTDPAREV